MLEANMASRGDASGDVSMAPDGETGAVKEDDDAPH